MTGEGHDAPSLDRSGARRRRRIQRGIGVGLGIVALLIVGTGGWFWWQLDPPGDPGDDVTVEIVPGWGTREIADTLASKGVVGSSLAFQAYVRITDAGPFDAGQYQLREKLGVRDAVDALEEGPTFVYEELALPPGLTLAAIAARVGELEGRDARRFLQLAESGVVRSRYQPRDVSSLEGLTWPDTYFVSEDQTDEELLELLVDEFDANAAAAGIDAATGITAYEAVIIGSLIQTEAGVPDDRPLISAVVHNRLADATPLQIDATVIYARGGGDGPITVGELERPSPYNTYTVPGLPPTPIATVTTEALSAAIAPADVPYRYYVLSKATGEHAFATTFEEHEQNVERAREAGLLE